MWFGGGVCDLIKCFLHHIKCSSEGNLSCVPNEARKNSNIHAKTYISVLVLKTRSPSGSQSFALVGVPEQALGGFPWVWIDFGSYVTLLKFHV